MTITPEIEAKLRQRSGQALGDETVRRAEQMEIGRQLAREKLRREKAAQRPRPKLVFDGEDTWHAPEWLVDLTLPSHGLGMLFGETDVGKTFASIMLATAIASGRPWFGRAVKRGTVLFVEAEGSQASLSQRKDAAKIDLGLSGKALLDPLPIVMHFDSLAFSMNSTVEDAEALAVYMRDGVDVRGLPPIRFVVIDTLSQNFAGNVDSNAEITHFLHLLRAFLKTLSDEPVFGLLIHHPGHADKHRGRGAYALPADLDVILHLEAADTDGDETRAATDTPLVLICKRMREAERFADIPVKLEKRTVERDGHQVTTLVMRSDTAGRLSRADARAEKRQAKDTRLRDLIIEHVGQHPQQNIEQIRFELAAKRDDCKAVVRTLVSEKVLLAVRVRNDNNQPVTVYEVSPEFLAHTTVAKAPEM